MKKSILAIVLVLAAFLTNAQNTQIGNNLNKVLGKYITSEVVLEGETYTSKADAEKSFNIVMANWSKKENTAATQDDSTTMHEIVKNDFDYMFTMEYEIKANNDYIFTAMSYNKKINIKGKFLYDNKTKILVFKFEKGRTAKFKFDEATNTLISVSKNGIIDSNNKILFIKQ
jgi:uncharacterized protein YegP (UPF0339 family)